MSESYIIEVFCKIKCPFYEETLECNSCDLCPFRNSLKVETGGNKIFHLVTNKLNTINPEVDKFDSNEIIGIVIRWDKINHLWIWMGLDVLIDSIWCTDPSLEIKTTLEDPVENHKIMEKVSKNLVKFPSAKLIEDFSRGVGRRYYLGSSVDYLEIQRNIKKIKTIIKKYNLKSNIDFSDTFGTSSTGYDEYVCGLRLGSNVVNCCYDRDLSYSVLPIGILIL